MRTSIGNPYLEAHGQPMRVYEWVTPAGVDPEAAVLKMEATLPGVKLFHRGDGEVHGYVNTSVRPDGSLYICVHLYDYECDGKACPYGHVGIAFRKAPVVSANDADKFVNAVGEHPAYKLSGNLVRDRQLLRRLGFGDDDAPLSAPRNA